MTKADIRQMALALRARLSVEDRTSKSIALWERIQQLKEYQTASRICAFVGFGTEVVTLPMIEEMLRQGKQVAAPKVISEDPDMEFRYITCPESDLIPGVMGIPEPIETCSLADTKEIDLILVPAVAWDLQGYRVGYGGGYYDRVLAQAGQTPRVGIGFECQVFDEVVHTDHDLGVDILVTESRILVFTRLH